MNVTSKWDIWEEPHAKVRTCGSVRDVVSNGNAYSVLSLLTIFSKYLNQPLPSFKNQQVAKQAKTVGYISFLTYFSTTATRTLLLLGSWFICTLLILDAGSLVKHIKQPPVIF